MAGVNLNKNEKGRGWSFAFAELRSDEAAEKERVSAPSASCLVIYDGRLLGEAARSRTGC